MEGDEINVSLSDDNESKSNFVDHDEDLQKIKSEDSESKKDKLVEDLSAEIHKRRLLTKRNHSLQQKLEVLFSTSSGKGYLSKLDVSEEADESTFKKLLEDISAKESEVNEACDKHLAEIQSLKEEIKQKKESLEEFQLSFKGVKEKALSNAVNSETGERLSANNVKELLLQEEDVSKILQEHQFYSIQKRHNLNLALEKKRNLAEGPLDFAEYEMMCIETQNNQELIQTISEEIKNIKKRASNIINISSHLGQKLYLAQKEKSEAFNLEKKLEAELKEMRDRLFKETMKYNKMKHESKELQHKFILLQHPKLIEDYKRVQQENEEARKELKKLKKVYEDEMKAMNKKFSHKN